MWKQHLSTIDALCYRVKCFKLMFGDAVNKRATTLTKCYNGVMWVINFQIFKR